MCVTTSPSFKHTQMQWFWICVVLTFNLTVIADRFASWGGIKQAMHNIDILSPSKGWYQGIKEMCFFIMVKLLINSCLFAHGTTLTFNLSDVFGHLTLFLCYSLQLVLHQLMTEISLQQQEAFCRWADGAQCVFRAFVSETAACCQESCRSQSESNELKDAETLCRAVVMSCRACVKILCGYITLNNGSHTLWSCVIIDYCSFNNRFNNSVLFPLPAIFQDNVILCFLWFSKSDDVVREKPM